MNRREFMKTTAAAAVAGGALMAQGPARGANRFPKGADGLDHRNERPDRMQYRQLGKTKFMCSRLVFGCGAALAGGKAVRLLGRAYDQGVNFFDVGYDDYYKGSERHLAAFLKAHRDEVWVTSKAPARVTAEGPLTANGARGAAKYWTGQLDLSLGRLELDYVDAYYFMGVSDPELVRSDELASAFAAARDAGKVGHAGISTHENAQECLEAAIEADYFSIAMIAICPAGWYDYRTKELLNNKGTLKQLRLVLDRARDAGIGLMAMKAARPIATVPYGGKYGRVADDTIMTAFDRFYDERLMNASLSPYQRSYAYVLENGLDVVNSDMQNFAHFEENLIAARDSRLYLA
jgi:aryl-alcohol dehydrogenase-like predicted oxidoreductase